MNFLMVADTIERLGRVVIYVRVRAALGEGRQWQTQCRSGGGGYNRACSRDQDCSHHGERDLAMEQHGKFREHTNEPLLEYGAMTQVDCQDEDVTFTRTPQSQR
jgi:hypothetical protein